jgi:GH24 family phage-related lysozyme (muramidase)
MDDPNTTPMEAAALGREASSQIANVLNLGFKAQDQMLEKARLSQDALYKNEQLKISLQNANSRARASIAAGNTPPKTEEIPMGDGSTEKMQWSSEANSFIPLQVSRPGETSQTVTGNDLISLVKGFENFEPKAYNDYKQTSVGYGTKGKPGEVLTEEQASERLQSELFGHAKRIEEAAALKGITLNKNQFNALTSFDFNTGRGANLIERFGDDPQQLASKILEYNKAGGEVKGGLVKRRRIEAALFLTPEGQAAVDSQVIPQNKPRIGYTPPKPQPTSRIVTGEEAKKLGGDPNKEYIVVNEGETTTRVSPVSPDTIPATQRKELAIAEARILYDKGDPVSAAQKLNAYGIQGLLGGAVSPNDLLEIFGERRLEQVTPPSTETTPNQPAPAKRPLGEIIE